MFKTESSNKTIAVSNSVVPVFSTNTKNDIYGIQTISLFSPIVTDYINSGTLNSQLYESFALGTGTVSAHKSGFVNCNISTGVGDYALLRNRKVIKYRNGYTYVCRGAIQFDQNAVGVANHLMAFELGTAGNSITLGHDSGGLFFGYSTGGRNEIRILQITTASTATENATITLNGNSFVVPLTNASTNKNFTAYQVAKFASYSGYETIQIDDCVVFAYTASIGPQEGTFSFTSGSAVGSFTRMNAGIIKIDTKVYSSLFNGNKRLVSNFNPYDLNNYEIQYADIGAEDIILSLFDPSAGIYRKLHEFYIIQNTNRFETLDFYIQRYCASLGSGTALSLQTLGVSAGYFGDGPNETVNRSENVSKTISAGTRTNVCVLKHLRFQNGMAISNEYQMTFISVSADGTKPVNFRISVEDRLNLFTIGANTTSDYSNFVSLTPSANNNLVSPESVFLIDETSLTYTPSSKANVVIEFSVSKDGSLYLDLIGQNIILGRNDVAIITCISTGASDISLSAGFLIDL
jgi:hypothetical protein